MESADTVLLFVGVWAVLALFNSWRESRVRHRCGARVGLFAACPTFVADASTRCAKHLGMRKKLIP
jgi:hypothetical protein